MTPRGENKMGDSVVGIIGMGDMGIMYTRRLSDAGWRYDLSAVHDPLWTPSSTSFGKSSRSLSRPSHAMMT